MTRPDRHINGSITVRSCPELSRNGKIVTTYEWRPTARFRRKFPADFALTLHRIEVDGHCMFAPAEPSIDFLMQASFGGLMISAHRHKLSRKKITKHHVLRFLFQYVRSRNEFMRRQIKTRADLATKSTGSSRSRCTVLPEDLFGEEEARVISRVFLEGKAAARALGNNKPTNAKQIQLGLFEAAKRQPLFETEEHAEALIRMAIFAPSDPSEPCPELVIRFVKEQLYSAISDHLDDSTREFANFLRDPKSDLVHRIAKRKECPEQISRDQAKRLLLEFGWQGYRSVAKCIDAQMRAFRDALPQPLNGWDKKAFDLLYLKQRWLGGLSMILLRERLEFLSEAFHNLIQESGDELSKATFQQLLWIYAEIMLNRREDDRQYQQRRKQSNIDGRTATEVSLTDEHDVEEDPTNQEFRELAKFIAIKKRELCEADFVAGYLAYLAQDGSELQINFELGSREFAVILPRADFEQLAQEWMRADKKDKENDGDEE